MYPLSTWTKFLPFIMMLGFVFAACCGSLCSSSPERETELWKENTESISKYKKKYKALRPFLEKDLKGAKKIWKKASKAEGDQQISLMQDANLKVRSLTKKIDTLESKIKKAKKAQKKLKKLKRPKDEDRRDEGMRNIATVLEKVDENLNTKKPDDRDAAKSLISAQIALLDDGIDEAKYALKAAKGKKVKRKKKKKGKKKGLFSKKKKKKKKSKKKKGKKGKLLKKLLKKKR